MTRALSPAPAALLFLVLLADAANAQETRVEITPFVGYRTGGGVTDSATGAKYSLGASASWGAVADVSFGGPGRWVELLWTRQETTVPNADAFGPSQSSLTLDTFLVGGRWETAPNSTLSPFLAGLVGLTRLDAAGSGTSRFTASLSGGVKVMPLPNFGLRLEARALAIFATGGSSAFCGMSGCTVGFTGWGELQGEFSAGLVVAF